METSTETARSKPSESTADGETSNGTAGDGATGTRRKLTDQQEAEVTRLYAETDTPVSEISKRFGIGESSVYRVAQRHGAALRGRTATSTPKPRAAAVATTSTSAASGRGTGTRGRTAGRAATGSTGRAATSSTGNGRRTGASRARAAQSTGRRAAPAATRPAATPTPAAAASGTRRAFRVSFVATRVFTATDMADAMQQAEAAGATEITGIVRND
jgi:transposase-like protein